MGRTLVVVRIVFGALSVSLPMVADAAQKQVVSPLPSASGAFIKLALSLVVIITLIVLLIRFLSRKTVIAQKGSISIVAARQVAPNRSVQVIDVGGRKFLIGVGEEVSLLADVTEEFDEAGGEPLTASRSDAFGEVLRRVRSRYSSQPPKETQHD